MQKEQILSTTDHDQLQGPGRGDGPGGDVAEEEEGGQQQQQLQQHREHVAPHRHNAGPAA